MAIPLSALTSVCNCSKGFETIGYAQFHVMCEFDCKFEKKRQIFITQFTLQTLFSKKNLKLTIRNNVPILEQYSEFVKSLP